MSQYEFQVSVDAFLAANLNALQSKKACLGEPISVGGIELKVQRITFGDNSIRHRKPVTYAVFFMDHGQLIGREADGFQTQLTQDITLHVATVDGIRANPNSPAPIVLEVSVRLVFDIDYYAANGRCYLRTDLSGFEWGKHPFSKLPPGIDSEMAKAKAEEFATVHFRSPLKPFEIVFPLLPDASPPPVINAGITVNQFLQIVSFRVEVGNSTSNVDIPWRNFFSGFVTDRRESSDWGYYVARGMFELALSLTVEGELKSAPLPGLELRGVDTKYSNAVGAPTLTTTIDGIYDLPDPLGTLHLAPQVRTALSVEYLNQFIIDIVLPDIEGALKNFIAPFVKFGKMLPEPLGSAFAGILDSARKKVKSPSLKMDGCDKLSDLHWQCRRYLTLPDSVGGELRAQKLAALDDGIVIAGSMSAPRLTDGELEASYEEFDWKVPEASCGTASATAAAILTEYPEVAPAEASIYLQHTGTRPVYVCGVTPINDLLGVVTSTDIGVDDELLPTRVGIRIANPGSAYAESPYPLDFLVWTSAGTRLVRLPPVPELTQEKLRKLVAEQLLIVANCHTITAPWWRYPHGFNPRWLVDPPFEKQVEHLWRFEITGLSGNAAVTVSDREGKALLVAKAFAGQPTRFSTVLSAVEEQGFNVARTGRGSEEQTDESARGITINQQLLVTESKVSLPSPCSQLLATALWVPTGLVAVHDEGIVTFDLSTPSRPRILSEWSLPDVKAVLDRPTGLLVVTATGLLTIGTDGKVTPAGPQELEHPLLDAVCTDEGLYVLTEKTLEFRSEEDFLVRYRTSESGRALARLQDNLVVGGPEGFSIRETSPEAWSDRDGPRDGPHVLRVLASTEVNNEVLAVLSDSTTLAITIWDGEFALSAEYARPPWFALGTRLADVFVRGDRHPDLFVRTDQDPQELIVSRFSESRQVGPEAMRDPNQKLK
ncbi:hypothetical protein NC658_33650 [Streptomyces griseoincarnatus]|uniref:Uncharacterized protein n=1 Tax=Streptomyces griseoincarnatus TaxID=29305 RepID=A0ABT0W4E4_STRGI|nr:hypothetical protein [Streptomyces griseoincarnatus]MCM2518120.1 hypothetical protein [Streptomyces griseoincarnatus]